MAGRQDHSVGGGGMDPEVALKDQVDLTHAGDKEAEKFKPREDDYDATSKHAEGSSGEKVRATLSECMLPSLCSCQAYRLACLCLQISLGFMHICRQPPELLKLSARLDQLEHTTALLLQQLQESRQQLKESKLAGNMYIFR